jgi:hypothetical protein
MELVLLPPQDAYPVEWTSQLAMHEYRHVVQLSKLNQGFTRVLSLFTGEIATGSISSLVPSWVYEGDAVYAETKHSISGRGKIPGFEMPLRTLVVERQRSFSYDKAVFGSFRDFVPDRYLYGYQVVNYARAQYGNNIWPEALDFTARYPFVIWPLAFYLKKNLGVFKSGLYRQTIEFLKNQYNKQKDTIISIDYISKNMRRHPVYTSYTLPKDLGNGNLLALRKGLDDRSSFVVIDSQGHENKLFATGYSTGFKCDVAGNLLVWDEVTSDPRWNRRDYSVIRIFDLEKGRHQRLTKATRYFSPDFSPGGKRIAVVETDLQNNNYITILDACSGERLFRIPVPGNKAVQFPEWTSDSEIVAITVSEAGKQLESADITTGQWTVLFPYTSIDISEPLNYKEYIFIRGSFKGIENIYAIRKSKPSDLFQVTFSRFGAYHPAVSQDSTELLFSCYSQSGFDIAGTALDTSGWKLIPITRISTGNMEEHSQDVLLPASSGGSLPGTSFPVKPYRKFSHLLRFHSWTPFYANPEELTGSIREIPVNPGVRLYSQNLLSTLISGIGYRYVQGNHEFIPTLTWRGWYPVIEFTGRFGKHVNKLHAKCYIPLVFTGGKYITWLQPQAEYEHADNLYATDDGYRKGIDYLHYKLYMSHHLRLSARDLYPRWGQYLAMTFTHTPFEEGLLGDLMSLQTGGYFPGLMPHHHIHGQLGLQFQNMTSYFLPFNRIPFPRGYPLAASRKLASIVFNYSFPAGYPDLSLGPLLYLKRIRMNLFYDWCYGTDIQEVHHSGVMSFTGRYRSYGAELMADTHIIRIIFPVSIGVRLGYIPAREDFFSEVLVSVETGIF